MAKRNLGEKIKLSTYDEMFGTDTLCPHLIVTKRSKRGHNTFFVRCPLKS